MLGSDERGITRVDGSILSLTRDQNGKLQISFYDQDGNNVPYQVKWELSKYCCFLEEVFYQKQAPTEKAVSNDNQVLLAELLMHNSLFRCLVPPRSG